MKKLISVYILVVEAVLLILLCALGGVSNITHDVWSFPFKQVAAGLRLLSLSGNVGNIVSWCLYTAFCLIPLVILIVRCMRKTFRVEDIILAFLSGILFVLMYYMINPLEISGPMLVVDKDFAKFILSITIYSAILAYLVSKLVRILITADSKKIKRIISILFFAINAFMIYLVFGGGLNNLLEELTNLEEGNTAIGQTLIYTKVFLCIEYAMDVFINLMVIVIIIMAQDFIDKLNTCNISDSVVKSAKNISLVCSITLILEVVFLVLFNFMQVVFMKELYVVHAVLNIPVALIIAMLIFMAVSRFIIDAKAIKDENDMFI